MSNTIKIEFECPVFETELEINIVIRKDGEGVVETATTSYPDPKTIMTEKNKKETIEVQEKPNKTTKTSKKKADASANPANGKFITGDELESVMNGGGNLMDLTF